MSKKIKNIETLGHGIYTIPDLALILNISKQKARRWMNEYFNSGMGEYKYSNGVGINTITDFKTLIEFYVFYQLREMDFGVAKIMDAHEKMSKNLKTPYPFASVQVLASKKDIFYTLDSDATVNTNKSDQLSFRKIMETFCTKIEFSDTQIANRFFPLGKNMRIVVDPHHQFGQPIIDGTNILTETIFSMFESGEQKNTIAILFDLTAEQVGNAISFYKRDVA